MTSIIRLENVTKIYTSGKRAVNGISLNIKEGEHVSFFGAPGSGKSTLMRLIAAMETPSDGEIFVMDRALHKMKQNQASDFRNKNYGVVLRETGFMHSLNLLENVALPLTVRGMGSSQRTLEAKQQLKSFGLLYAAGAFPDQISNFEAQLASIARALISKPKLLLLDEIAAALSQKEEEQLLYKINEISKAEAHTIISFSGTKSCALQDGRYFTIDYGRIQEDKT